MPFHNVHLAQTATARGWEKSIASGAKDSLPVNVLFDVSSNPQIGTKTVSAIKRPGSSTSVTVGSSARLFRHGSSRFSVLSAGGGSVYEGSTQISGPSLGGSSFGGIGGIPKLCGVVTDAIINDVGVMAFVDDNLDGWYLWEDAISKNFSTFSASLTSGQATIVGMASTGGLYDGQAVSGSGITAGTMVDDVINSSMVLLSAAVTQSGTKTVTKDAVAIIRDTDFPSDAVSITFLGTRFHAASARGPIYQSAANDPSSYSSSEKIVPEYSGDNTRLTFKIKNYIAAAGLGGTVEYFYDAGNASGSVLSRADNLCVNSFHMDAGVVFVGGVGYCLGRETGGPTNSTTGASSLYRIAGVNQFERVLDDVWSGIVAKFDNRTIGTLRANGGSARDIVLVCDTSSGGTRAVAYDPGNGMASIVEMGAAITSAVGTSFTKSSSSSIFVWSGALYQDSTVNFTVTIQTDKQDPANGLAISDKWVDLVADTETGGTVTIETSDDDYQNWVSKGSFNLASPKKRVHALGFHDAPRAYRIQYAGNTPFRCQLLRVNFEPAVL